MLFVSKAERNPEIELDPEKGVLAIADVFGARVRDFRALRSIGVVLFHALDEVNDETDDSDNEDQVKQVRNAAVKYLNQSLSLTGNDHFEKGATLYIMGKFSSERELNEEATKYFDQASMEFSKIDTESGPFTREQMEDLFNPWDIPTLKARCLQDLGETSAALEVFNQARSMAGDGTIDREDIEALINVFDDEYDPNGRLLMENIKNWSKKERNVWLGICVEDQGDMSSLEKVYGAAKVSGEKMLVLEWLTEYGRMLPSRSSTNFNLEIAQATFYKNVLGDVEKAKDTMRSALDFLPKRNGFNEYALQRRISTVRMDLADIIFTQFCASSDPGRKMVLLHEIKSLPGMKSDDAFKESHVGMLVANMLRIMGPAQDYQEYMDGIFKTCIEGLEDSLSWNDGSSLRLLAKVLGCLDGLQDDARIALSSQFSIMDRTIYYGSEEDTESSPKTNGFVENYAQNEPSGSVLILKTQQLEHQVSEVGNIKSSEKPPASPVSKEEEEDLSEYTIYCDGCGIGISRWKQPLYLCLICPDTDLCQDCLYKRVALDKGDVEDPRAVFFCGERHCYIKGPIDGWKGIKNGVIRAGDLEVKVKNWLKGLKEERWPKAWENYWLQQGGLKNIE